MEARSVPLTDPISQEDREANALTFDEFWGDGHDHAMSWDIDTVQAQAEAAWDRSRAVQQEKIDDLQKHLLEVEDHIKRIVALAEAGLNAHDAIRLIQEAVGED